MQFSEESVEMATAHYIIACLRNQEDELVVYKDPLKELFKAIKTLRQNLAKYSTDPVDVCIPMDVFKEIYNRMIKNDWTPKRELTEVERKELIEKLAKTTKVPELTYKEIKEDLSKTTNDFLLRLDQYPPEKRHDLLALRDKEWNLLKFTS